MLSRLDAFMTFFFSDLFPQIPPLLIFSGASAAFGGNSIYMPIYFHILRLLIY
jgi:hypothetical protein